ncbi:MAG: hypothetical protein ACP5NZ_04150 [Nanobdellota archaeon]
MTKKDITKKVLGIGTGLALGALPMVSNAQDYAKIQKGINAPTYVGENETHVAYHFRFNKDLQKQVNGYKNSQVYITGDKLDSYLVVDPNKTGYTLYYSKKNLNENGEGKKIGVAVTGKEHIDPCAPNVPGSKTNGLASLFWGPIQLLEQPKPTEPTKEPSYNSQTIINKDSHDTYNYNYGDTAKAKEAQQKLSHLELRTLIEGFKTGKGPYFGGTAALQIGNGNLWIGPYGTYRFGSEKESIPIYSKDLVSQSAQIFAETDGVEKAKLACPTEVGVIASIDTDNDLFRFDVSYGIVNKVKNSVISGFDRKLVGNAIVEEKSYGPTKVKSSTWESIQKIGVAIQPSQKVPIYIKGEVGHIGKITDKKGPVFVNGAVGGNIRWGRK